MRFCGTSGASMLNLIIQLPRGLPRLLRILLYHRLLPQLLVVLSRSFTCNDSWIMSQRSTSTQIHSHSIMFSSWFIVIFGLRARPLGQCSVLRACARSSCRVQNRLAPFSTITSRSSNFTRTCEDLGAQAKYYIADDTPCLLRSPLTSPHYAAFILPGRIKH